MSGARVLAIGATGNTGRPLLASLNAHYPVRVRTATRAAEPPTSLAHVQFDWLDPSGHEAALAGVDRIYLVAPVGEAAPIRYIEPFLTMALKAGVQRTVLLNSSAVDSGEPGLGEVDALIRAVSPEWAILRPSWFMQNFTGDHPLARSIRTDRRFVTATGEGRLGFIDADDIGRTAAAVLAADTISNEEHILTGPESLSYSEAAKLVSDAIGCTVTHVPATPDEYATILTESGYDPGVASALAGLDERISSGSQDMVTGKVEELTGSKPRPFAEFVTAYGSHL